jgi:ATP-dependent RNA helicase HelY
MKKFAILEDARRALFEGMGVPEKATFVADDFQREAIDSVVEGHDTLVVAPTGSGKTYIAFEAISANLYLKRQAVYTTPLKALSNTKYNELKRRFEPEFSVGLLTGDRKIDTNSDVVVATTEIYRNELYENRERHALVVLDEVHFIADPQRGPVWEESIILTSSSSTLLMLSASISNAEEIAAWLEEVRGRPCRIVTKKERSVQLRYGFLHPDLGILPLRDGDGKVFKEVLRFYGTAPVDTKGTKLRMKGGAHRGRERRGRRS